MRISCVGSGYVGSVTAAALAALGHQTTVIDIDRRKVDLIQAGRSPIFEPGLDQLLGIVVGKTLMATDSFTSVADSDVVFIAVGTPGKEDGGADLRFVKAAADSIGKHISRDKFTVIVDKSTVPIGTADLVSSIVEMSSGLRAERDFAVVSNPEFLREGYAVEDIFLSDRIVIGTENEQARRLMRDLYHPLLTRQGYAELGDLLPPTAAARQTVYFETSAKSAEMIKYASNAFLAVKISYINEVARLCEKLGANALDVAKGMGLDSRVGNKFLQVSSGWSGSCFPKDTAEFYKTSLNYDSPLTLVGAAIESNYAMHMYCVSKLKNRLQTLVGKNIGILGLTFKPNTDDARQTQASLIIRELVTLGAEVRAYDPKGMEMFREYNPELPITYCSKAEDVASLADAVVLLTHWDEFSQLDWKRIRTVARQQYVLDTRNFFDQSALESLGFVYEGVGV